MQRVGVLPLYFPHKGEYSGHPLEPLFTSPKGEGQKRGPRGGGRPLYKGRTPFGKYKGCAAATLLGKGCECTGVRWLPPEYSQPSEGEEGGQQRKGKAALRISKI